MNYKEFRDLNFLVQSYTDDLTMYISKYSHVKMINFDTFKYDDSYLSLDVIGFLSEIEEYVRCKSFSLFGYKQVSEIISVVKDLLLQLRIIEQNMFINSYKHKEIILPKLITMFLSTMELVRVNSMEFLDRLQIDVAPNCTKELEKLNQLSMLFL